MVFDRHDLTCEEWARLEPLLPERKPCRGGRWVDHRMVVNGVFWRYVGDRVKRVVSKTL